MRFPLPVLILATVAILSAAAPAGAEDAAGKAELAARIQTALEAGRWEQALELNRQAGRLYPGDPRLLYNLACLENRNGDPDAALAALKAALAAGFDEMGFALQDPDLAGVADRPDLFALDEADRSALFLLGREKGPDLQLSVWSGPIALAAGSAAEPGIAPAGPDPQLRLRWQPFGLDFEFTAPEPWAAFATAEAPPWFGGPGLVVILAVPDTPDGVDSANSFSFAFGREKGAAVGAMFMPGPDIWQPIAELNTKVHPDADGRAVLTMTLPWQAILPYHPLTDPVLGLNVMVRQGRDTGYAKAALVPDPWAWAPAAARHRYLPVTFELATVGNELFMGRVSDSLSGTDPVTLAFTATCPEAGPGRLTINVLDQAGESVRPGGPVPEPVDLDLGPNRLVRQADFTGLPPGSYLVQAALVFPSGKEATWSTPVLQLGPGWTDDLQARIAALPAAERPTAEHLLTAVTASVERHLNRRHPGPIATTLGDLQSMLAKAEQTGTILPDRGALTMVYPGPDGGDRLCSVYVAAADSTDGEGADAPLGPVLVFHGGQGFETRIIDRIGRNHEFGELPPPPAGQPRPIYLVPHLPRGTGAATTEATACLDWALRYLGADRADIVGIDAGGGEALGLARDQAPRIGKAMVFAGRNLAPWPDSPPEVIGRLLGPPPPVPVTWIDFPLETAAAGQAAVVLAQLQAGGWDLADVQEVRGGLSLSQAADRLVLWELGLAQPDAE